ncbi:MAG: transporter substrate-binding domain-containing protein [Tatlockia sp.]|nr:transporter substrate-binding domain-containing protein [Tatlockia sp.]
MKVRIRLLSFLLYFSIHASPLYASIKIGTEFFFPPFVMSPTNGFDIGLMQTLCQRLEENCQFVYMNFHELFQALDKGQIDLAVGGIAITLSRLDKYIFSLPYKDSQGQFLILAQSNIKSIADLNGEKVGVIKEEEEDGGLARQYLVQNYNKNFNIIKYNNMEDLIAALSSGDIPAAFLHRSTNVYWMQHSANKFRTLGGKIVIGEGFGIMALPKNAALIQHLNQLIIGMEKDNSYLTLYKTYFVNE